VSPALHAMQSSAGGGGGAMRQSLSITGAAQGSTLGSPRSGLKTEVRQPAPRMRAPSPRAPPTPSCSPCSHPPHSSPSTPPFHPAPLSWRVQVDQLFARVQEHDDSIVRLDATIEKNAVRGSPRLRCAPLRQPLGLAPPPLSSLFSPSPLVRAHSTLTPATTATAPTLLHPLACQAIADDSLKAVQASLKASLASLRDEMNRKIQALTIEIAQLQKQMNVGRGEQSILAQQQKDTSKRVDILSSTVSELSAEIVGDDHAPSAGAVQGSAY
jgi:hypothetical protein